MIKYTMHLLVVMELDTGLLLNILVEMGVDLVMVTFLVVMQVSGTNLVTVG